jgi:hypothetical protein
MILEMDTPFGGRGKEAVWMIDQPAGVYRLELSPVAAFDGRITPGKYEIKLAELRATTAADSQRLQAQATYLASRTLWRSNQPADRKAAIPKLDEAARLLENDPDNELRTVVENRLLQLAPMLRVERMNLTKTPGMVTTYHSADLAKEAAHKRALLESMLNFYQPLLKHKFELSYALLNKADWKRLCPDCSYMMPIVMQEPIAFLESNDIQTVQGMLAMYKSKMPATLNDALAAEGLRYETVTPVILDAAGYFNLAGALRSQTLARLPRPWMHSVIEANQTRPATARCRPDAFYADARHDVRQQ